MEEPWRSSRLPGVATAGASPLQQHWPLPLLLLSRPRAATAPSTVPASLLQAHRRRTWSQISTWEAAKSFTSSVSKSFKRLDAGSEVWWRWLGESSWDAGRWLHSFCTRGNSWHLSKYLLIYVSNAILVHVVWDLSKPSLGCLAEGRKKSVSRQNLGMQMQTEQLGWDSMLDAGSRSYPDAKKTVTREMKEH